MDSEKTIFIVQVIVPIATLIVSIIALFIKQIKGMTSVLYSLIAYSITYMIFMGYPSAYIWMLVAICLSNLSTVILESYSGIEYAKNIGNDGIITYNDILRGSICILIPIILCYCNTLIATCVEKLGLVKYLASVYGYSEQITNIFTWIVIAIISLMVQRWYTHRIFFRYYL